MLNIKDNLCLFALSWLEIKLQIGHCQGGSSSLFIHKMYKKKDMERKIVNLEMKKMNKAIEEEKL